MDFLDEFKEMSRRMDELANAMFINPFMEDFFDVFTKKRLELIRTIIHHEPESIRALAKQVQRNIKNVFNDLQALNECNIISFKKVGRKKKPVINKKTIIVKFNFR